MPSQLPSPLNVVRTPQFQTTPSTLTTTLTLTQTTHLFKTSPLGQTTRKSLAFASCQCLLPLIFSTLSLSTIFTLFSFPFISVKKVSWRLRSLNSIRTVCHDNVWDSPNPESRHQCDDNDILASPPDKPLYTRDGYEISRRIPAPDHLTDNPISYAPIIDFKNINFLFGPDQGGLKDYERAGPSDTSFRIYPQAGLVDAGHIQASGLPTPFYPLLERLNKCLVIQKLSDERDLSLDIHNPDDTLHNNEVNAVFENPSSWPVYGVSSQMYNSVMHHTRGSGKQYHEVITGQVTAALGSFASNTTHRSDAARKLLRSIKYNFPHAIFEQKSQNHDMDRHLRLENTFWIDIRLLPNNYRNARYISFLIFYSLFILF